MLLKVIYCIVRTEYTSNKTSVSFEYMCEWLLEPLSWKSRGSSSVVACNDVSAVAVSQLKSVQVGLKNPTCNQPENIFRTDDS